MVLINSEAQIDYVTVTNVKEQGSVKNNGIWVLVFLMIIFQTCCSLQVSGCTEVWKSSGLRELTSVDWLLCSAEVSSRRAATNISSFVVQVSERETMSQSAESPLTDAAVSTSHNGPLTSGTSKQRLSHSAWQHLCGPWFPSGHHWYICSALHMI